MYCEGGRACPERGPGRAGPRMEDRVQSGERGGGEEARGPSSLSLLPLARGPCPSPRGYPASLPRLSRPDAPPDLIPADPWTPLVDCQSDRCVWHVRERRPMGGGRGRARAFPAARRRACERAEEAGDISSPGTGAPTPPPNLACNAPVLEDDIHRRHARPADLGLGMVRGRGGRGTEGKPIIPPAQFRPLAPPLPASPARPTTGSYTSTYRTQCRAGSLART